MSKFRDVDFNLIDIPDLHYQPDEVALPRLCWLNIADLVFDDSYQRPLLRSNVLAIKKLAQNFDWRNFSTAQVAPVEHGKYAVLDGQHRIHAAAAIGIRQVPCQIMEMSRRKQASSFAAINGAITNISVFNIYRASLAAGAEWAVDAERLTREAGCVLKTSNATATSKLPGEIYSIVMVRRWIELGQGERMKLALRLMRQSEHGEHIENYTHVRLRAWGDCFIERNRLFAAHSFDRVLDAVNALDLDSMDDAVSDIVKNNRRNGINGLSKFEYLRAAIGTAIDKALPVRLAIEKGGN